MPVPLPALSGGRRSLLADAVRGRSCDALFLAIGVAALCGGLVVMWSMIGAALSPKYDVVLLRPASLYEYGHSSPDTLPPFQPLRDPKSDSTKTQKFIIVSNKRIPMAKWLNFQARLNCVAENSTFSESSRWILMHKRPLISYGRPEIHEDDDGDQSFLHTFIAHNLVVDKPTKPEHHGFMYAWIPRGQCPLSSLGPCQDPRSDRCEFDDVKAARAMRGRPLLLVGDSTQFTLHNVILSVFYRNAGDPVHYHGQFKRCLHHIIVHHASDVLPFKFRYVRNDWLVFREEDIRAANNKTLNVYAFSWTEHLTNDTVLFLNRGMHFRTTAIVIADLRRTLSYVSSHFPGALIVYRNTHLPRSDDQATDMPVNKYPPLAIKQDHIEWGWQFLDEQNKLVEAFIRAEFPQVIFLRVDHMTRFRTDSRIDYVHLKHPGAPDWW